MLVLLLYYLFRETLSVHGIFSRVNIYKMWSTISIMIVYYIAGKNFKNVFIPQ